MRQPEKYIELVEDELDAAWAVSDDQLRAAHEHKATTYALLAIATALLRKESTQ